MWIQFSFLLLLSVFALVGCDTGDTNTFVSPTPTSGASHAWMLIWSPSAQAQQSNTPEVAFVACTLVQRPDGSLSSPASVIWLASSPDFALILVHLDPVGQHVFVGVMGIDPLNHQWILQQSFSTNRPASGTGLPARQQDTGWTLPSGNYESAEATNTIGTTLLGSVRLWLSDTQQEFVLAHMYASVKQPAGTTSIVLNGRHGWVVTQQGITTIVIAMDQGTLIFAGTTPPIQSQQMVTQALAHLDTLLP